MLQLQLFLLMTTVDVPILHEALLYFLFWSVSFCSLVTENKCDKYLFWKKKKKQENRDLNFKQWDCKSEFFSRIVQPYNRAPASFSNTSGRTQPRQETHRPPLPSNCDPRPIHSHHLTLHAAAGDETCVEETPGGATCRFVSRFMHRNPIFHAQLHHGTHQLGTLTWIWMRLRLGRVYVSGGKVRGGTPTAVSLVRNIGLYGRGGLFIFKCVFSFIKALGGAEGRDF